jgi:rhamnogalacturonyl hydrolase YesR
MTTGRFFGWAVVFGMLTGSAEAQPARPELRLQVQEAVTSCADYMAEVLLDSSGKSRCDYELLQGKWHDYEPPWHTGQIIFALVEAYRLTGEETYLKAAKRAGDWWVGLRIKDHPVLNGMVRAIHGDGINNIVFATVSDGTAGLFRLYEATGERKYAEVPTSAGKWMLAHMYEPGRRMFYDCVDPATGSVLKERSPFWPDKQTQTFYDVARPNNEGSLFKDMYQFTKDEQYRRIFLELCESLLATQDTNGLWMDFVPNDKRDGSFHPRFNLWYAESLLEGFELVKDPRYLEAARRTARTFARFQQKDGTIYYTNYLDGSSNKNSICGSAVAFAGIVWLRLLQHGAGEEFRPNIERSLAWLLRNRYAPDHPDRNLARAILETRVRTKRSGIWMTQRDIATSFGVRFLCDYMNKMMK